jgi:hypothetical protein
MIATLETPLIARVGDGLHWSANYDDHVQGEDRMIFVCRLGRSTAGLAATIVHGVPLLYHLNACAVRLRIF